MKLFKKLRTHTIIVSFKDQQSQVILGRLRFSPIQELPALPTPLEIIEINQKRYIVEYIENIYHHNQLTEEYRYTVAEVH